jgi:hypothetical protein
MRNRADISLLKALYGFKELWYNQQKRAFMRISQEYLAFWPLGYALGVIRVKAFAEGFLRKLFCKKPPSPKS